MRYRGLKAVVFAICFFSIGNISVLSFAQETVAGRELESAEVMAEDVERIIEEYSMLICEDGTVLGSECFDANVSIMEWSDDMCALNASVDVYLPSAIIPISIPGQGVDSTSSMRLNMTIYVNRKEVNSVTYGVLSRVSGSSTALQPGTSVTGGTVKYATYGGSTTGGMANQLNTSNVGSSFSLDTGFKHYVNLAATYNIGAVWTATITRGGSSWTYALPVSY